MGNFSRDPINRLADSLAKHYVGVRMQQGVPVLDADWNELEDLRRSEVADVNRWVLGNGVPVGSTGFRIVPIAGGAVGTIVLIANTAATGWSSVTVDVAASTAAAALGFDENNCEMSRFGSSPARITSNNAEPFALADGDTLVIQADDMPSETVTFAAGDFADISAATAAEVALAITDAVSSVSAEEGAGNDFLIKGGGGSAETAGRIMVDGQMAMIEDDLRYSEQPLYLNNELATLWSVDPIDALVEPATNELHVVYLDLWHREVNTEEDPELLDMRIGIETAVRLRREWAVRVSKEADYLGLLAVKPEGHAYYILANLQRQGGNAGIEADMILDQRETDVSLRPEIAYRAYDDTVLVDTERFLDMLSTTRDNYRDFVLFLTTRFIEPDTPLMAGELIGIDVLNVIAGLADHGIALINTDSMDTRGAFRFFDQLLTAENRFVTVWEDTVFPIVKPGGQIYEITYSEMLEKIKALLTGPPPGGFLTITDALSRMNLWEAVHSQEQINSEIGQEIGRPTGYLTLTYLGSPNPTIIRNENFDLRYEISGSVTPDDDIDVEVFIAPAWQATPCNEDGSLPLDLHLGPGADDDEFLVRIKAPNVASAETTYSLRVSAHNNDAGLYHITSQKTLRIGDPPPTSEEDFIITIQSTNVSQVAGVYQAPTDLAYVTMNFELTNNTDEELTADLEYEPETDPQWTIQKGSFDLTGQVIPPFGSEVFSFRFIPPSASGIPLAWRFRALDHDTSSVVAEIQIELITVNP